MALRSHSVLDILLPPIITVMQDCSQALNTCKRLCLSCEGVSKMLLVLSITFVITIYGVVCCSTGLLQFRWLKSEVLTFPIVIIFFCGCVPVSEMFVTSYSVTYCIYIPENRDFVFIIIAQLMMSANSRIRFGLQIVSICLYITPSDYHHCANLSEDIELIKCLSDICCWVRE